MSFYRRKPVLAWKATINIYGLELLFVRETHFVAAISATKTDHVDSVSGFVRDVPVMWVLRVAAVIISAFLLHPSNSR